VIRTYSNASPIINLVNIHEDKDGIYKWLNYLRHEIYGIERKGSKEAAMLSHL
jgi:hypothetical protein